MIIAGILLLIVESMMREQRYEEIEKSEMYADRSGEIRGGAVVMIGPLPVVIGSDQRMAAMLMALAITLMALWLISTYLGYIKP